MTATRQNCFLLLPLSLKEMHTRPPVRKYRLLLKYVNTECIDTYNHVPGTKLMGGGLHHQGQTGPIAS